MVQTQVTIVTGGGSDGGLNALSLGPGDAEPFLEGDAALDKALLCSDERFKGLGKMVILGDDFKKPA